MERRKEGKKEGRKVSKERPIVDLEHGPAQSSLFSLVPCRHAIAASEASQPRLLVKSFALSKKTLLFQRKTLRLKENIAISKRTI